MPKFRILELDETKYWNEVFVKKNKINKLIGLYVYDPNTATHCCELTPSYELNFIHTYCEFQDDADDDIRDYALSEIQDGDYDTEPVKYMHCNAVDKIKGKELGEFDNIEDAIEDALISQW